MNNELEEELLYTIIPTTLYKKELKKYKKQPKKIDKILKVVELLQQKGSEGVPPERNPHLLTGNYKGCMECHIEPDLLLIWKQYDDDKIITLNRVGTHSELFN